MVFCILLVSPDRELAGMQPAVEQAARRFVGPYKLFTATKAVDAVSTLHHAARVCGNVDVAMLSHQVTCPGKMEFADALRKVLKEKYPETPIICWGKPNNGGERGKHFHHTLEAADVSVIGDMLSKVQAGQLVAEWKEKGRKSLDSGRKSIDGRRSMDGNGLLERRQSFERPALDRTGSIRISANERPLPLNAGPSMRRSSVEIANRSASISRTSAGQWSPETDSYAQGPSMGSMGNMGSMPRMVSGMVPMVSMGSSGQFGGVQQMAGMGSMQHMAGMQHMGSMAHGVSQVQPFSMGMGGGMGQLGMGMVSAGGMSMQPGYMQPMATMQAGMGGTMGSMAGSVGGAAQMPQTPMQVPVPSAAPATLPTSPAPDVTALLSNMTMGPTGGNSELIRMLAEEVVRLRKAVEVKRRLSTECLQPQGTY